MNGMQMPDPAPENTSSDQLFLLGTRLVTQRGVPYRYGQAGDRLLEASQPVYSTYQPEMTEENLLQVDDGLWRQLKPEDVAMMEPARIELGWPEVDVPPHHYFWLREKVGEECIE